VPFRKAYLQSLIDVIEVDDHQIRIKGTKDLLEKAVLARRAGGLVTEMQDVQPGIPKCPLTS
jgi:hypothetical protein